MSLTVNPDRIITGAPLRQAALQMQPDRGPASSISVQNRVWFETPPETKPGVYSGVVHDRLTAIGKIVHRTGGHTGGSNAIYLVRCCCGTYETRSPRALRFKTGPGMCQRCEHTERLKKASTPALRRSHTTPDKAARRDLFIAMRLEVKRLGLSWSGSKIDGGLTYVSIDGRKSVAARDLVVLGSLERLHEYLVHHGLLRGRAA